MKFTQQLNLGTFIYENEKVNDIDVQSFLGIPYATAERFGMPTMIESYKDDPVNSGIGMCFPQNKVPPLINAFLKNPMMRKEILTDKDKTSENAFVLNIWTNNTRGKKPVLVFIHGGGFTYGSGTTPLYNGRYLAAKGIVVVTLNYRLGVEGFIPVMINGKLSVNRGFFDQQRALKWIRCNIGEFGGDTANITLLGQSAGGLSVSTHMMSEESSKYFDQLIVCSAGANECMTLETAEKIARGFLKNNRLSNTEELLSLSTKKLLKLKMPLEFLASPVIDGVLLKDDARILMEKAEFSPKPVMLGTTEDELEMINNKSWYRGLGITTKETNFREHILNKYGQDGLILADELRKKYQDITKVQFKMMEMFFHVTALREMKLYSNLAPCYGYRLNFVPNIWNGLRGAYHCAEFPFIFGTLHDIDMTVTEKNLVQMEILQNDWIAFIKNGNIPGREPFGKNGKITLYEGTEAQLIDFPQREIIEKLQDSGLFSKIAKSFMRGRDDNFIA
ncbi:MAG TPA: carboxylesterase family protein [Clostridiaceae bacterium]|nr:carboxylesterase family protein [Clostridiaceae bacterium]